MTTHNSPLQQALWEKWFTHNESDVANKLIQSYMYLVTFHVDRIAVNLPNNINKDDLKSYALMGLYDAMQKFEPERQLKFDTYASFRIRGSIIDGLRKEDWLPRSLRDKTKQIEETSQILEQRLHRLPTSSEIADEIGMSAEEVETIQTDSLFANVLSIDQQPANSDEEHPQGIGYSIPNENTVTPGEHVLNIELKAELAEGIKSLNENEQLVISLFYHEELTMTEIGKVLDLTTSRISQVHKQALFKLRKILKKMKIH